MSAIYPRGTLERPRSCIDRYGQVPLHSWGGSKCESNASPEETEDASDAKQPFVISAKLRPDAGREIFEAQQSGLLNERSRA